MPGPQTPVSGCALKRLEVHNGSRPRVYDSTLPAHALSLSFERENAANVARTALVLLVHCAAQRMLSIRLTDLLESPKGQSEAISLGRTLHRLRIRIEEQSHTIVADFQEARDFNLASYVLQKSGFRMNNDSDGPDTPPVVTNAALFSPPSVEPTASLGLRLSSITPFSSPIVDPTAGLGPRLSSITAMSGLEFPYGFGRHDSLSPTNSQQALQPSEMQSLAPRSNSHQAWSVSDPHGHPQPRPKSFSQPTTYNPHLNPYNVFLEKARHESYRPRVSSPLRSSFHPVESARQLLGLGPMLDEYHATTTQRAISLNADTLAAERRTWSPSTLEEPVPQGHCTAGARHFDIEGGKSDNSQAMISRKGLSQEFRKMLPQPRSLPFTTPQRKRKSDIPSELTRSTTSESEPAAEETPAELPESGIAPERVSRPVDKETPSCRSPAPESEPTPLVQPLTGESKLISTESEVPSPAKKRKTATQKHGNKSQDKSQDNTQSKPLTPPNAAASNRTKEPETAMTGNTTETPIQQEINSTTKQQQTQSSAAAVATEEHADHLASPWVTLPRKCKKSRETAPASAPIKSPAVTSKGHADRLPSSRARPPHVRPPRVRPSRRRASPRRKNIPEKATTLTTVDAESQTHWDTTVTIPLPRDRSSKQNASWEPHILELPMVITESMLREINEATSSIFDQYEIDMQRSSDAGSCAQLYLDKIMTARRDFWCEKLVEYGPCFPLL